jgi:outer membrane receptor for ferrienterochelin and colicin
MVKVASSVHFLVAVAILSSAVSVVRAQTANTDLGLLSLEELMSLKISTATLVPEMQSDVPARVQVIRAAQIERRGYRSLLDVLKDLPDFKVDLRGNWNFPAARSPSRVCVAPRALSCCSMVSAYRHRSEEFIGIPQNPRRISAGIELRLP